MFPWTTTCLAIRLQVIHDLNTETYTRPPQGTTPTSLTTPSMNTYPRKSFILCTGGFKELCYDNPGISECSNPLDV